MINQEYVRNTMHICLRNYTVSYDIRVNIVTPF